MRSSIPLLALLTVLVGVATATPPQPTNQLSVNIVDLFWRTAAQHFAHKAVAASAAAAAAASTSSAGDHNLVHQALDAHYQARLFADYHGSPVHHQQSSTNTTTNSTSSDTHSNYSSVAAVLAQPTATESMQQACARGFCYFRFGATLFWPDQMKLLLTNSTLYWQLLDSVFAGCASIPGCRLVPSLLWNTFCLPDLYGQPLGQLFVAGSALNRKVQDYVQELIGRYTHPASAGGGQTILFVEMGNEFNLLADLNLTAQNPNIAPSLGTPTHRTKLDNFSSIDLANFQTQVAGWVRSASHQPLLLASGHAAPRSSARHLMQSYHRPQRDWTPDSEADFVYMLNLTHTSLDLVTVHIYPGPDNVRFGKPNWTNTSADFIIYAQQAATQTIGKPFYLGEYGTNTAVDPTRAFSFNALDAIATHKIFTSTMWVWEFNPQSDTFDIEPSDVKLIDAMQTANKILRAANSTEFHGLEK